MIHNRAVKGVSAVVLAVALVAAGATSANAKSSTKKISLPSSNSLTAYAYIQDWSDPTGCGSFSTKAKTAKSVAKLTNSVQWDPIGIGVSASIKGAGVSVSGNNTGSPTASITGSNTHDVGISGTACMSWGTFYLGVFSTASTRISNHFYSTSVHL